MENNVVTIVCPYRINTEIEYAIVQVDQDENGQLQQVGQTEEFAPCMGNVCPFYDYLGFCNRALKEIET